MAKNKAHNSDYWFIIFYYKYNENYFNIQLLGKNGAKEVMHMYKKQEKYLMWLAFVVAGIMVLSILGKIIGS